MVENDGAFDAEKPCLSQQYGLEILFLERHFLEDFLIAVVDAFGCHHEPDLDIVQSPNNGMTTLEKDGTALLMSKT